MYINLGGDVVITYSEMVAMIDLNAEETDYGWQKQQNLIMIDDKEHKTLVITPKTYYISPISVATLKKRMQTIMEERK